MAVKKDALLARLKIIARFCNIPESFINENCVDKGIIDALDELIAELEHQHSPILNQCRHSRIATQVALTAKELQKSADTMQKLLKEFDQCRKAIALIAEWESEQEPISEAE